ncbi:trehalose-phosphatase [Moraxella osloensis]|nr:trehalose-phosphatase [Moraxella osloensis]MDK1669855.1 trehalose-phosphatase [Moraxella osloensis]
MSISHFHTITYHSVNSPSQLLANNLAKVVQGVSDLLLLLDIDGTLSEFHPDPQQSFISNDNLAILSQLQNHLPIWLVTGRSVADARRLTAPLKLPVIGSHGLQCDTLIDSYSLVDINLAQLQQINQSVVNATDNHPHWRIEQKPFGVALHFREHPELAASALTIMQGIQHDFKDWQLKAGKCVYELLPQGVDKGSAINHVLNHYHPHCRPIFIGDDVTDEAGFIAVQSYGDTPNKKGSDIKGIGVKVGCEPTHAHYYVSDVSAVTALLQGLLTLCQS